MNYESTAHTHTHTLMRLSLSLSINQHWASHQHKFRIMIYLLKAYSPVNRTKDFVIANTSINFKHLVNSHVLSDNGRPHPHRVPAGMSTSGNTNWFILSNRLNSICLDHVVFPTSYSSLLRHFLLALVISKLDLCEDGSVSKQIFTSDIQISVFLHLVFYICLTVRTLLCRRQYLPKMCILFCLVLIK